MITYQEIYDTLRKEKYSEALQPLRKNFLLGVAGYIKEKREIINREQQGKNLFSDTVRMTRKQLDNTLSIIKEIIAIRERKVLNLAFTAAMTGISKRDTDHLLKHEQEIFEITARKMEQSQQEITKSLNGEAEKEKDLKNLFIRFKEDVPAFLDANSRELGPFNKDDVANLPKEIVQILIGDNKAILIEDETK